MGPPAGRLPWSINTISLFRMLVTYRISSLSKLIPLEQALRTMIKENTEEMMKECSFLPLCPSERMCRLRFF
jgi:hypothetical protein